ncbi:MAG: hypothetical protein IJ493_02445 [Clostridia bacterium]|nr:hypothetical protein [Clostridia bacterium]
MKLVLPLTDKLIVIVPALAGKIVVFSFIGLMFANLTATVVAIVGITTISPRSCAGSRTAWAGLFPGKTIELRVGVVWGLFISVYGFGAAVTRWGERRDSIPADSAMDRWLDKTLPDDYMEFIYPNMIFVDE